MATAYYEFYRGSSYGGGLYWSATRLTVFQDWDGSNRFA